MITLERESDRALGVRPSVSAVIFDRLGRLLLQQRSDGGQWGLPGGSVEIGEFVSAPACRARSCPITASGSATPVGAA